MPAKLAALDDTMAQLLGQPEAGEFSDEQLSVIGASMAQATVFVADALQAYDFDRATRTDVFMVDPEYNPYSVGLSPRFFLARGFVDTGQTIEMRLSTQMGDLASGGVVSANDYYVDDVRGTVLIVGYDTYAITEPLWLGRSRYFAQVSYTCGFTTTTDSYGTTYQNVPEWLQTAGRFASKMIFEAGGDCEKDSDTGCAISDKMRALLSTHVRYEPASVKPLSFG